MKNENFQIGKSYQNTTYSFFSDGYDYLNDDLCLDLETFEERYSYAKVYLNEKFDYLGEKDLTNNQKEFLYELKTPDNSVYYVKLNIFKNKDKLLDTSILVSRSKNLYNHDLYIKLLEKTKSEPENYELYVLFYDSENNFKLTNKNKHTNESFVVFRSLENSLNHFLYQLNYLNKISIIKFFVDKNETKRMVLYKRIMNRLLADNYPHLLEDKFSNNNYDLIIRF